GVSEARAESGGGWQDAGLRTSLSRGPAVCGSNWTAFAYRDTDGHEPGCSVAILAAGRVIDTLELEGATTVGLRASGDRLVVYDSRGRLLVLAPSQSEIVWEWRVS